MPDPFSDPIQNPNFVNQSYATPQQIAQQRAYANSLLGKVDTPVIGGAWTQGAANMLNAYLGAKQMSGANKEEQAATRTATQDLLEAAQSDDRAQMAKALTNPNIHPATAVAFSHLMQPGPPISIGPDSYSYPSAPTFGGGVTGKAPISGGQPQRLGVPPSGIMSPPPQQGQPVAPATPPANVPPQVNQQPLPPADVPIVRQSAQFTGQGNPQDIGPKSEDRFPDLPPLDLKQPPNKIMDTMAERKAISEAWTAKQRAKQAQVGQQEATTEGMKGASNPTPEEITSVGKSVLSDLENESPTAPLTGTAGHIASQIPSSPASDFQKKLQQLKNLAVIDYSIKLKDVNPGGRLIPILDKYEKSLGFDVSNNKELAINVKRFIDKYNSGETPGKSAPTTTTTAAPAQGGKGGIITPANAASPGGTVKVLRTIPKENYAR